MDQMSIEQAPNAAVVKVIMDEVAEKYGHLALTRDVFYEIQGFVEDRVLEETLSQRFHTRALFPNSRWANYSHMRLVVNDGDPVELEAIPVWVYDDEEGEELESSEL